jgi:hypothetical protein
MMPKNRGGLVDTVSQSRPLSATPFPAAGVGKTARRVQTMHKTREIAPPHTLVCNNAIPPFPEAKNLYANPARYGEQSPRD